MEAKLQLKKVNVGLIKNGICPRCGCSVTKPILARFKDGSADFYKCAGGHTWIIPAVIVPKSSMLGAQ